MSSLAQIELPQGAELESTAAGLLGSRVVAIEPGRQGGNNRLYRVTALDGVYALKFYPRQAVDPRDRQGAEAGALRFLERYAVSAVPRLVAEDRGKGCSAFDWIEGRPVDQPGAADVDGALRFLAELQALAAFDDSARLPLASAATLSPAALCSQIDWRLARCRDVALNARIGQLGDFLDHSFAPVYGRVAAWAQHRYAAENLDFSAELPLGRRTLSPSDFGFHNALRRPNGRLAFLDFEYFGWDDPVKMVADFLWHPGMELGPGLKSR
ncbi:MAG: aminoglycoside phosphotransferase family protein, partial [Alphaproteobacteria bacterium]|nr:aminoglycoside phosphotransferase family protein [Alphaproteobacteria bacterium]